MRRLLFPALISSLFFASCLSEGSVEGSFDGSHSHEGGPSKVVETDDLGINLMLEQQWGMLGINASPSEDSRSDDEGFLPYAPKSPKSSSGLNIADGIELVRKGGKVGDAVEHLTYLNLYGDVRYNYQFPTGGKVFGGLGPYIGYGLGGALKSNGFSEAAFGGDDGYKRFDAGLHIKAGYEFPSSIRFTLGYELGLYDKSNDPSDYTSRNRTFAISAGYSINKIISALKKK